jgi:hypothetical protein
MMIDLAILSQKFTQESRIWDEASKLESGGLSG